jgi:nucleoid-associated protein EbfC
MKQLNALFKQAQEMQAKMQEMQAKAADAEVTGSSGGGMVAIVLNGKTELKSIKLDRSLVDPTEVEVLEDLIIAAFNDAKTKLDKQMAEEMAKMTGGLPLPPGFKMPF